MKLQTNERTGGTMKKYIDLQMQAITKEYGCVVYCTIKVSEDYTMNEVVNAVRDHDYCAFRLPTMKRFVNV